MFADITCPKCGRVYDYVPGEAALFQYTKALIEAGDYCIEDCAAANAPRSPELRERQLAELMQRTVARPDSLVATNALLTRVAHLSVLYGGDEIDTINQLLDDRDFPRR